MLINKSVSFLLLIHLDLVASVSPVGWGCHSEMCYLHSETLQNNQKKRPWEEAQDFCQSEFGTNLATIYNSEINSFVTNLLIDLIGTGTSWKFWVGAKKYPNATLKWIGGMPVDYTVRRHIQINP